MSVSVMQMQHALPSYVHLPYIQRNHSVVNVTETRMHSISFFITAVSPKLYYLVFGAINCLSLWISKMTYGPGQMLRVDFFKHQ